MTQTDNDYSWRRIGSRGCEILDANGVVVAWAANEFWGATIAQSLNSMDLGYVLPKRIKSCDLADASAKPQ